MLVLNNGSFWASIGYKGSIRMKGYWKRPPLPLVTNRDLFIFGLSYNRHTPAINSSCICQVSSMSLPGINII